MVQPLLFPEFLAYGGHFIVEHAGVSGVHLEHLGGWVIERDSLVYIREYILQDISKPKSQIYILQDISKQKSQIYILQDISKLTFSKIVRMRWRRVVTNFSWPLWSMYSDSLASMVPVARYSWCRWPELRSSRAASLEDACAGYR